MKTQFKHKLLILIFSFLSISSYSQGEWKVWVLSAEELDGAIEGVLDQIQIRVENPTGDNFETHFLLEINQIDIVPNPVTISNTSIYEDFTFDLNPLNNLFTVRSILDNLDGIGIDDLDFGSTSDAQITYIKDIRKLPPGTYTTCLSVFNTNGGDLLAKNCAIFHIPPKNPPQIQTPADLSSGAWISEIGGEVDFTVSWIQESFNNNTYILEIKKFDSYNHMIEFDPNDNGAFDALPSAIVDIILDPDIDGVSQLTYQVNEDDVIDLEPEDFIAIRVTAQSEINTFLNEGRSNIVICAYGVTPTRQCDHPNFSTSIEWPIAGDTLPFRDLHYVVFVDPLCSSLREISGSFQTTSKDGTVDINSNFQNRWRVNGGGPYNFMTNLAQRNGIDVNYLLPDSTYAQHFPLVHLSEDRNTARKLFPNESGYRMTAEINYLYYDQEEHSEQTQTQNLTEYYGRSFFIGMPKPKLISPQNDAKVLPGQITLNFSTGNPPTSALPSFQILKINHNNIYNPYLNVQEKLVLQVSNDSLFTKDSIIFDGLRTIQASSGHPNITLDWTQPSFTDLPRDISIEQTTDREYHEDDFLAQVYRNGEMSFNFENEDTLFWRVVWLKNPEDWNVRSPNNSDLTINDNDIYHISQTRRLITSNDGSPQLATDTSSVDNECVSRCEIDPISNTSPLSDLAIGDKFNAGQFEVTVTHLSSNSGTFTGRGTILIPFFNDVNLMCDFSGIRINTDRKLISGDVHATKDPSAPFRIQYQTGSNLPYIDSTDVEMFNDWMNEGERIFDFLTGKSIGLPIGINREIDGRQVILGMIDATFSPRSSNVNFVTALEIPELNTFISAGANGICLQPNGLSFDSLNLYLPYDHGADFKGTSMKMKGGHGSDLENICYMTFDCNGFKRAQLAIEGKFSRNELIPDSDGSPSTDLTKKVSYSFKGKYGLHEGLIMSFTMDPFYINGVDKIRFRVEEAFIDLSSVENPPSIHFPENYIFGASEDDDDDDDDEMENTVDETWEGFYLKTLSLDFADELIESEEDRIGVGIHNFIYDGDLTFKIGAYNIISDGHIEDWKATLDTIELVVTQSEVNSFDVIGKLEPPIAAPGEYMNYRMIFDFEENDDYYIQVDVQDSLNIPLMVAKMHLEEDSYIRIGYESSGAYIRANFSGAITINDGNAGSDLSSIPGMSIPGLRFQDFLLDSEHGVSCVHWDFGGLASGGSGRQSGPPPLSLPTGNDDQGFASGFPLSIDSMALGGGLSNPKLYIKASLNFQQGDNGISAGCALEFTGSYIDRKISLVDVDLKGIYVKAEFSAVAIEGALEWDKTETKEEIKGLIGVKIPMGIEINIAAIFGSIKSNPTAEFNTDGNYNYWLVDGSVKLGKSGVPICSGIALFGIGGGVWHHMKMDENKLKSPRETLAATDPSDRISNTAIILDKYSEDFNTFLGLRFNAVLGIQNSSSTLNLEVGILAEFTTSHGLSRLKVDGAVYVMQTLGKGKGKSDGGMLYGQASLDYQNNAETGKTFTGRIEVWLNVADIVRGAIDDNDKLADVNFYADSHKWYFHMGKYSPETGITSESTVNENGITPGASIKLSIPGQEDSEILKASAYMMVGYDIPTELPLPPERVRNILGIDSQSNDGNEVTSYEEGGYNNSVDYSSGNRINNDKFKLGQGFAFGTNLKAKFDIDAFIYIHLGLDLGFDVLLTKSLYPCKDIGIPGINGWYAKGQAYAALEGEIGIKFKFFGTHKVPILYLGVAMYLKAQLPNPNYFKGMAGVKFSVLGGMFEGQKTIKIELGEKCEQIVDPLANIKFIDKIEPNTIEPKASVFEVPTVFFNFPMNEHLILPKTFDPETDRPSSYYDFVPEIFDFKVKNISNNEMVAGSNQFLSDNKTVKKEKENAFAGNTRYETTCSVKVRDYTHNAPHRFYRDSLGDVFVETKKVIFMTGDYPDVLPESNIKYTYPIQNQRYFLQKESLNKGTIALFEGVGRSSGSGEGMFYTTKDGESYEYALRVTKATNFGDHIDMPISYSSGHFIKLNLPNLDHEQIYIAQLIRKPITTSSSTGNQNPLLENHGIGNNSALGNRQLLSKIFKKRLSNTAAGFADLTVTRLTSDNLIAINETKIFEFNFRTSKYDRLNQKIQNAQITAKTPSAITTYIASGDADVEVKLEEGFDVYDLAGYYKNRTRVVEPLIVIRDPMNSDYWNKKGISNQYKSISRLNNLRTVNIKYESFSLGLVPNNGIFNIYGNWPNRHYLEPILYQRGKRIDYFIKSSTNIAMRPLSQQMINSHIASNNQSQNNNTSGSSGGFFRNINPGGNSSGTNLHGNPIVQPGALDDVFFRPTNKKLLLQYSLSKFAYERWYDTVNKINSFYHLQYNVVIKTQFGSLVRKNLTKPIKDFIRINDSEMNNHLNNVRNKNFNFFKYVTSTYNSGGEFSQRISNRYQIWMAYFIPRLSNNQPKRRGTSRTKQFNLEEDNSRIPQGNGPH